MIFCMLALDSEAICVRPRSRFAQIMVRGAALKAGKSSIRLSIHGRSMSGMHGGLGGSKQSGVRSTGPRSFGTYAAATIGVTSREQGTTDSKIHKRRPTYPTYLVTERLWSRQLHKLPS